jgi:antitoxin MazE
MDDLQNPWHDYIVITFGFTDMETKLVVIGNSQGVRLPKSVVEECGIVLDQPLTIEVRARSIVLSPARATRAGWAEAASNATGATENLWGELPPAIAADDDWTW